MSRLDTICASVSDKLDMIQVAFNYTSAALQSAVKDARREMKISDVESVAVDSSDELYLELRAEYWMLHRLKNGQALNFRYTTGVDGRSVDKSMIPKMLTTIMEDLDRQFKTYMRTRSSTGGGVAQFSTRTNTRLEEDGYNVD
jgi:vancomycin resistance protein YoaR